MKKRYIISNCRPHRRAWIRHAFLCGASVCLPATAALAAEQNAAEDSAVVKEANDTDIIVMARKRQERISDVPVAIYALREKDLQTYAVTDIVSASKLTPGLMVSRSTNNSAAQIYLRGVGSSFSSPSFDQAVGINIDNVAISKGRAIFQSYFDMQQMEVLRGPQALFFGKNSTAGVISVQTADPTDKPEFIARAGYELNGREYKGEFIGSGPLSDTLGLRVAVRGSDMRGGYFKNIGPSLNGVARNTNVPREKEIGGRITLVYTPSDRFDVKAKISYDHLENDGVNGYSQLINCQGPGGTPQPVFGVPNLADGCKLDKTTSEVALNPAIAANFPASHGGRPYNEYDGYLSSVTAQYHLDKFLLSSVTGYYEYKSGPSFGNFDLGSSNQVFGNERTTYSSFTQEFRFASDFSGPFNFTMGLFYDNTKMKFARAVRLFNVPTADSVTGRTDQWDTGGTTKGNTYSAFTELTYQFTPTFDISGGARYSNEKKKSILQTFFASDATPFFVFAPPIRDTFKDDNVSPQVTLRWRPDSDMTLFASYKQGYKSGGSNIGEIPFSGTTSNTIHFDSEKAKGFEAGVKGHLFDGALTYGLTLYHYTFSNLQVSIFDPATVSLHVGNAGRYRTRGVELDGAYAVRSVDGLRFRGSVYFNDAEYTNYLGTCYSGQTIAEGCNLQLIGGAYTLQDYKGKAGTHAPKWTVSFGTDFEVPLTSDGLKLSFSADARYMSSYFAGETLSPLQKQEGFVNVDAAVRLHPEDDRWELALIGRNITDKLVIGNALDLVGTGSGTGTANGIPADTNAVTGKPWELSLQATVRW